MNTTAINRSMGKAEWAMLITLSLLWGGSFFFNAVAVRELPVLTIVAARVALAAVILNLVMQARGQKFPVDRDALLAFSGMGLLNNAIPFSLIVWGQSHIASGVASIFNAMTPIFTVIAAHYLTSDELLDRRRIAGVLLGLAGVSIMIGSEALHSFGVNVLAQAAVLCAALSYGFAGVFGRRFKALGISPMATATGQVTASSLVLVPLALLVDHPWQIGVPGIETIAAVFGVAAFSTALAYLLFFRILQSAGATNISLVTFLIPPSAIMLGIVFLGENLLPRHLGGLVLIAAGLAAIDGRLLNRFGK
ncbi:MAG: DMT family transporter [Nitratireductor sp.]